MIGIRESFQISTRLISIHHSIRLAVSVTLSFTLLDCEQRNVRPSVLWESTNPQLQQWSWVCYRNWRPQGLCFRPFWFQACYSSYFRRLWWPPTSLFLFHSEIFALDLMFWSVFLHGCCPIFVFHAWFIRLKYLYLGVVIGLLGWISGLESIFNHSMPIDTYNNFIMILGISSREEVTVEIEGDSSKAFWGY